VICAAGRHHDLLHRRDVILMVPVSTTPMHPQSCSSMSCAASRTVISGVHHAGILVISSRAFMEASFV
jgi:hypothetical protein